MITNDEKKSIRTRAKDIQIWKYTRDAVNAASKNIRARVV